MLSGKVVCLDSRAQPHHVTTLPWDPQSGPAYAAPDKLFIDIVNYSASIDGYSSLCVKNYDDDKELNDLFDLLNELKEKYLLFTNDDYEVLKSTYMRTKSGTITQLLKLKLNVQKNRCSDYLKIFERFDRKKQKRLEDLERMIDAY